MDFTDVYSDVFDEIDNADLSSKAARAPAVENVKPEVKEEFAPDLCKECGSKILQGRDKVVCQGCGLETEIEYADGETVDVGDGNTNSEGYLSYHFTGKNSMGLQKTLLRSNASYAKFSSIVLMKELLNKATRSDGHFPKSVIKAAIELYAVIRSHGYVFRKSGKDGVLGACVYYACYNHGITKTPNEISKFIGVEGKSHSAGDRILRALHEEGIIKINTRIQPINDYVTRYMKKLDINLKYKPFVLALIERAEAKKIHIARDSTNNTRSVGAIYMLTTRIPELRHIKKDKIDKMCCISRTTYMRYYNSLCDFYRLLKKVFKQYRVPMPESWRD
jgi:transcription initiation factor TFIIIB Brf1 subunit/transcription initiation factor TFIIB